MSNFDLERIEAARLKRQKRYKKWLVRNADEPIDEEFHWFGLLEGHEIVRPEIPDDSPPFEIALEPKTE